MGSQLFLQNYCLLKNSRKEIFTIFKLYPFVNQTKIQCKVPQMTTDGPVGYKRNHKDMNMGGEFGGQGKSDRKGR